MSSGKGIGGVTNRDVRKLVRRAVKEHGCKTKWSRGSSHLRVTCPNGKTFSVGSTSSSRHAALRVKQDFKREGVEL